MKKIKLDFISITLFAIAVVFTIFTYSKLPSSIPNTYTLDKEFTMMDKNLAITIRFIILLILVIVAQASNLMTKVDLDSPRLKTIRFISRFVIAILVIFHAGTIAIALGYTFNNELYPLALTSFIMIILGNKMPQIKMNRYFGFRLPWTIRDEDTWRVTHKLLGYTSFPFAIMQIIIGYFVSLNWGLFFGLGLWLIIATIYSLVFYVKKYFIRA